MNFQRNIKGILEVVNSEDTAVVYIPTFIRSEYLDVSSIYVKGICIFRFN